MSDLYFDGLFHGLGVEVRLKSDEDFLKVKETLTRIGVSNQRKRILYQSCHILHKKGRYSIIHFKELYALDALMDKDNKRNFFNDVSDEDVSRRNKIVNILSEWGLVEIVDSDKIKEVSDMSNIKVVKHSDLENWTLLPKYIIGKFKSKETPQQTQQQ